MNLSFFKDMTHEKKVFCTFLIIHLTVWTLICLIRTVMPTDALEGIYWGSLHDFGTPKHPPLAGWLTYLAYIPFKLDFCVYFMSQLFVTFGFIYIYKLARKFLDVNKSMLSVIIMEGCWTYSYITGYYGFNPDVILLFILPAISYYFYNCMHDNKPSDWLKLGLIVGIAFMNKYQTGLLIFAMAIWAFLFKRETFRNKYFYLSILIAFMCFLPHLLWLVKYDFFPLLYFESELHASNWINHITAPLTFILIQLSVIIGVLLIYTLLRLKYKAPFEVINIGENKKDSCFILLMGLFPILAHIIMGFIEGGTMRPRWGFEFWFMIGIMLFYFFPYKIDKQKFDFTTKLAYTVMFIIFLSLGTLLSVEKNYRSRYPVQPIFSDIKEIWQNDVGMPLKYIGGYIEWTLPLTIYGDTHPAWILDTFGYKNPWISEENIKNNGAFIIDREYDGVIMYARKSCPYLPSTYDIQPVEYKLTVRNAFNMPREYTVYYAIIPPMK